MIFNSHKKDTFVYNDNKKLTTSISNIIPMTMLILLLLMLWYAASAVALFVRVVVDLAELLASLTTC